MTKATFVAAVSAVPLCLAQAVSQVDAQVQKQVSSVGDVRTMAVAASANLLPMIAAHGDCTAAEANPLSKKLWIARMGCAGQGNLVAGLKTGTLTSSVAIPNVKWIVKVEILGQVGPVRYEFKGTRNGSPWSPPQEGACRTMPNFSKYTWESQPLTLEPNEAYAPGFSVWIQPSCGEMCAAAVRIIELGWEI